MAFYRSTRRTEEVYASEIRVFKQPVLQQQHDPENWFVLYATTCASLVDEVGGSIIGSTTTLDKKPFRFDLDTLSSSLSFELFANSIAQETGLFSWENCRLLAREISDGLLTKFKFSKDAIYGTTTSLAILVHVSRTVLEELDLTDFVAVPTDHGSSSTELELENLDHVVAPPPDNTGSTETAYSDHEEQQGSDGAVVIHVPAIILGTEIEDQENESNDHVDRSELTSSAEDEEQEDHVVATSTALNNKTNSAGDQERLNHVVAAAPTSPQLEEQVNMHVHGYGSGSEEEEQDDSGEEEEEDEDGTESLDSSVDVFDDGFFENEEDLIGDGPEGYEEAVAFEVMIIVGDDCRNAIESDDHPCPICLEGYYNYSSSCGSGSGIEVAKTQCGHRFHKHCITKWLAGHVTCPFCRSACIALV